MFSPPEGREALGYLHFGQWEELGTSFGTFVFPLLWPSEKITEEAWGNTRFIDFVLEE